MKKFRKIYPDYSQKIHLIVDGAGYNHTKLTKEWAFVVNRERHFCHRIAQISTR